MGGRKTQTVGYEYPYDLHFGLCYAADALVEFRGGDATAWAGRVTANGTIPVNAPNLWGGPDNGGEGGIVGPMDVMFGDDDQEPHPYLQGEFDQHSALRGKVTVLLRATVYGAYNPYPKPPAFKAERIFAAWPGDEPWYPETALVPLIESEDLSPTSSGWRYLPVSHSDPADYSAEGFDDSAWPIGTCPFGNGNHPYAADVGFPTGTNTRWSANTSIWIRRRFTAPSMHGFDMEIFVDNNATVWINGVLVLPRVTPNPPPSGDAFRHQFHVPAHILKPGVSNVIALKAEDTGSNSYAAFRITDKIGLVAMNPAHMLVYSMISPTMEQLPLAALDDAHWRVQAETLYNEGFGLCTEWIPGAESVAQFQQRICNPIGGFLVKSRRDGKWRLHLPRGNYDLESLPVLTDDDVLEWSEEPSTLDDAVNQLQVRWLDPVLKESRITPSEHALGAIEAFGGVISQTVDYPEIPAESLAMRVNARELKARSTPFRRISPTCKRKAALWDTGTYIRVQCPKRGIADAVLLLLRADVGETPTAAVKLVLSDDIYTLPATTYTGPQDPVDLNPTPIPLPAPAQRAFEAPYLELAATLPHAELAALPAESGYLLFVAAQPVSGINYALTTAAPGEEFDEYGLGDWCPTALVDEGGAPDETEFALSGATRLQGVSVGSAVLWDDELCRVDALDLESSPITLTLGRGCGDTVPKRHDPGSRIWFYGEWAATDQREYALGETIAAKALTRTSRGRLPLDDAPTSTAEMAERHVRPYPPANVMLNDESYPTQVVGDVEVTASHRDRLLQADQLVDQLSGDIGPEPGTTYVVRNLNAVTSTETYFADGIETFPHIVPAGALVASNRMEIYSVRNGYESWQRVVVEFSVGAQLLAEDRSPITAEDLDPIIME